MRQGRHSYFLFGFIILGCLVITGAPQESVTLDMANLGSVWDEYIANPGGETALRVYQLLPANRGPRRIQLPAEVKEKIVTKFNVLESQIYAGERNALKLAFRLFTIADNEMRESLVKIIGYLLRFNTRLFLQELQNHLELVPDLEQLLCSFRLSAPGDKAQQKLEKNIRLKALGYIEDKDLKAIKKRCIKILKKAKIQ
jgi:hypothetical protein